jgi:hypothetical protein
MKLVIARFVLILALLAVVFAPDADADPTKVPPQPPLPNYCSQTATGSPTYRPCPGDVTGPLRGGGNHRWPDGSDN